MEQAVRGLLEVTEYSALQGRDPMEGVQQAREIPHLVWPQKMGLGYNCKPYY